MMTGDDKLAYTCLGDHLARVVSAHDRVRAGIADHADKERVRRQEAYHKMEAERKLAQTKPLTSG